MRLGARQSSSVVVQLPRGNYKIKLAYHSGYLSCKGSHKTKFGCIVPSLGIDRIDIFVTDKEQTVLLPKEKGHSHDGHISNSLFVIFNDVIELRPEQILLFWYKENLQQQYESDNSGVLEFYAYAILQH